MRDEDEKMLRSKRSVKRKKTPKIPRLPMKKAPVKTVAF
jgi:hypothetical protein